MTPLIILITATVLIILIILIIWGSWGSRNSPKCREFRQIRKIPISFYTPPARRDLLLSVSRRELSAPPRCFKNPGALTIL